MKHLTLKNKNGLISIRRTNAIIRGGSLSRLNANAEWVRKDSPATSTLQFQWWKVPVRSLARILFTHYGP